MCHIYIYLDKHISILKHWLLLERLLKNQIHLLTINALQFSIILTFHLVNIIAVKFGLR